MSAFWTDLPRGVVHLAGMSPADMINGADDGPRLVVWPSRVAIDHSILDGLDRAALDLFPAWLPGAEWIEGPGGLGVAAVRSLAAEHASATSQYGPFLADLAERALRGRPTGVRFPDAVRATGLARVIASTSPIGRWL